LTSYISLFSGIEAASVAWEPLGWKALAFSEIEPFCCDLLQARYPDVPNLGDISNIDWKPYEGSADVIIGGSPCQAFSVAGRREGLMDERGKLMLEFVRAVREVRPRWVLWENVPGVLSQDGGRAFATLQRELGQCGYGLAWRVLDAQFFGVPQRRRRVFLVGHPRVGCAAGVLFEPDSLRGDNPPSRVKREELAASAGRSLDCAGGDGIAGFKFHQGGAAKGIGYEQEQSPTLTADWHQPAICLQGSMIGRELENGPQGDGINEEVSFTLNTTDRHAVCFVQNQRDEVRLMGGDGELAGAVTASQFTKGQSFVCLSNDADATIGDNVCSTLKASADKGAPVVCIADDTANAAIDVEQCGTLKCGGGIPAVTVPECWCDAPAFSKRPGQQIATSNENLSYALTRSGVPRVTEGQRGVRRLTPTECERLQGFPDGWTQLGGTSDGARYKALGNSMAVPVIRWLGERIDLIDSL